MFPVVSDTFLSRSWTCPRQQRNLQTERKQLVFPLQLMFIELEQKHSGFVLNFKQLQIFWSRSSGTSTWTLFRERICVTNCEEALLDVWMTEWPPQWPLLPHRMWHSIQKPATYYRESDTANEHWSWMSTSSFSDSLSAIFSFIQVLENRRAAHDRHLNLMVTETNCVYMQNHPLEMSKLYFLIVFIYKYSQLWANQLIILSP